ncbi:hypothetical protein UFOVP724_25 [uncultured Caudovirales phage]|uniref:Uncharacterized protein n=1 Tax=uncultured Caudovirales phage TaxID=2100421 RepID=A0A6J5NLZ1_9CAUD|nr:hypothetical protein UFOVP724_25 [uncultured Caudovirales phage]
MNDVIIIKKLSSEMSIVTLDGATRLMDKEGNFYSSCLWFTTKSWQKGVVSVANHQDNMILFAFDTAKYESENGQDIVQWMESTQVALDFVELSTCWMFLK